jgi:PiT family inorganic phosphate transporter
MEFALLVAIVVIGLALFFGFTNGFHDAASQVATVIVSGALSPRLALPLAAIGNFIGAAMLGTTVAETIGSGIVDPRAIEGEMFGAKVMFAALFGAVLWNLATWYFGMPSSSSHALIGGLLGAFVAGLGFSPIHWEKVGEIIAVMFLSPLIGLIFSYLFTRVTFDIARFATPKANRIFRRLQIFSLIAQALSHGTNDSQKTMGVMTFVLILLGFHEVSPFGAITIPRWVVVASSLAIAFGTLMGGWRIIKKLGAGLYRVRPIHAFSSQVVSALTIYLAAVFGFPISTTQVISSSVIGAGAATRPKMVRWFVARDIAIAWLMTIPLSALISGVLLLIIRAVV